LFDKKPSGDIYKKQEAAAVKQAVKNIVSTNRYEKPFNMNFGSNITGMLFELAHSHMDRSIEQDIRSTLHKYEPRAKILDINIVSNPDAYTLRVRLTFRVMTTGEIIDLETTISRLR
jgi:phage baseplate assembly protein W